MAQFGLPKDATPLHIQRGRNFAVLVGRDRGQEVTGVRQAVGADRAALGESEKSRRSFSHR